jgi:hypothetical protein
MAEKQISPAAEQHADAITVYDLAAQVDARCKGFSGALFDGRYVYYIPLNNGQFHGCITRYDTLAPFADESSWSVFDLAAIQPGSKGFVHGAFDGRYLYLAPYCNGEHHGQVARYDTRAEFADAASWIAFDSGKVHADSKGFIGAVYAADHVYFVPYQLSFGHHHGLVTRYNTRAAFDDEGGWETFDMAALDGDCRGFHGGIFDGRYVYFCPYLMDPAPPVFASKVVRYDTRADFADIHSWQVYDVTEVDVTCKGFIGAVSDGQYLYFVPYNNGEGRYGQVLRYNTRADFASAQSWERFDTCEVDDNSRGFFGALFDGRFVYFVPHCKAPNIYNGQMTRYDTRGHFSSTASWAICDTAVIHPNNKGFIGGAFDGRYLYLPPFETEEGKPSGQTVRLRINADEIWTQ